jgi:hypothetical protein
MGCRIVARWSLIVATGLLAEMTDFRIGHHSVDQGNLGYFLNNNMLDAGAKLGIPGFDGDVRFNNPGLPIFTITRF